jgi:hypothetical protein
LLVDVFYNTPLSSVAQEGRMSALVIVCCLFANLAPFFQNTTKSAKALTPVCPCFHHVVGKEAAQTA